MPGQVALAYTQQTVTTVAKQILAADPNRRTVQIMNDLNVSTDYVFLGGDNSVSTATGTAVQVGQGGRWDGADAVLAIWAIAKSGTQTLDIAVGT